MGAGTSSGIGQRIGQLVARTVFATVAASALLLTYVQADREIDLTRKSLENTGYVLASASADALANRDTSKAQEVLSAVSRLPNIDVVSLHDAAGKHFVNLGQRAFLKDDITHLSTSNFEMLLKGTLPVSVDIVRGGQRIGVLSILADISDVRRSFLLLLFSTAIGSVLAAIAGVSVSKPLQRRIVQPVRDVTRQIIDIRRSGVYTTRVQPDRHIGEVGFLIESFNALMGDIRQRDIALKKLAYHDPLTGLPNRPALLHKLDSETSTGALAVLDLRRFRSLNEAFGQAVGDAILLDTASRLESAVDGHMVARVSNHEFAVLFHDALNRQQAEDFARDIRARFATPLSIGQRGVRIDVDVGIVMLDQLPEGGRYGSAALQCAGLALNLARQRAQPGITFFSGEMRERVRTESELGQDLRAALAEGGLEVHYQSVMDLATGSIVGFESLSRWCHPKLGYVAPSVFIPVAESNGLIGELGRWVLNESCRQAAQWARHTGKRRFISVNVSAAQFLEAGFTEEVEACLRRHSLPPELLSLELTESIFVGASASAIREGLHVLSRLGVKLSLDDFGTGYSSLSYLTRLPITTIKIDRAFVANAGETPRRKALLKSIIDMSHSVGMDVVAEGAETREELELLRSLGAEKVQGYIVARPLPAAEAFVSAEAAENAIYTSAAMERVA